MLFQTLCFLFWDCFRTTQHQTPWERLCQNVRLWRQVFEQIIFINSTNVLKLLNNRQFFWSTQIEKESWEFDHTHSVLCDSATERHSGSILHVLELIFQIRGSVWQHVPPSFCRMWYSCNYAFFSLNGLTQSVWRSVGQPLKSWFSPWYWSHNPLSKRGAVDLRDECVPF